VRPERSGTWQENIATSPANCAWVRILIQAWGVGPNGALQFDDMVLVRNSPIRCRSDEQHQYAGDLGHGTNAVYLLSDAIWERYPDQSAETDIQRYDARAASRAEPPTPPRRAISA
jgi:hypothetical protein